YSNKDINHRVMDVSAAVIPDFSDLDVEHYPYLSAYTSRSCPFQCHFCSDTVFWGKYRKKSAQKVAKELTILSGTYKYQLFLLSDLLLNPVVSDLAAEFRKSKAVIYWDGCLRVDRDVCNPDNTILWRQGGFYRARLGIESGSPRMLKAMNKKITRQQVGEALISLSSAGIQTTTFWVIGFPGETGEDFQQTLNLIEEFRDHIYEAECRPFYYYLTGQAGSGDWNMGTKKVPLYPRDTQNMLLFQTWMLDTEPSRAEIYRRVNRFVQHCAKLGVPNPYNLVESYEADHPKRSGLNAG
ncbi:MAG: radical SAM protein, partial [bacterium]|nr:radical SAM protein [bacterium]